MTSPAPELTPGPIAPRIASIIPHLIQFSYLGQYSLFLEQLSVITGKGTLCQCITIIFVISMTMTSELVLSICHVKMHIWNLLFQVWATKGLSAPQHTTQHSNSQFLHSPQKTPSYKTTVQLAELMYRCVSRAGMIWVCRWDFKGLNFISKLGACQLAHTKQRRWPSRLG